MSYGLSVLNDVGLVQIDDNFENYILIQEGVATTGSPVAFPATGVAPLVMVGATPVGSSVRLQAVSANSFTLKAINSSNGTSGANFTIPYRVYGRAGYHAAPPDGFGLQVLTPAGAVAFDSRYPYMRIRQSVSVAAASLPVTVGLSGYPQVFVSLGGTAAATYVSAIGNFEYAWVDGFALDIKTASIVVRHGYLVDYPPQPFPVSVVTGAILTVLIGD